MLGLPLAFATPLLLSALVALPVLYWLLRLTPPAPKRVPLPTLPLVRDLIPEQETPARTPWWLLALRLLLAAVIILAMAGPVWNPRNVALDSKAQMLIVLDGGWASAPDWAARVERAAALAAGAQRDGRPVALRNLAEIPGDILWSTGSAVQERLRAMKPAPHSPVRAAHLPGFTTLLATAPGAEVHWITDRVTMLENDPFPDGLRALVPSNLTIHAETELPRLALTGPANLPDGLVVRVLRAAASSRDQVALRALDAKGRAVGETRAQFARDAHQTTARFDLPLELRNEVSRVEITGEASAGAVALLDANDRRRRVGIVSGENVDTAQPLLSAAYYVAKAIMPYADVRQPPRGAAEGIARVADEGASVMILTDIGTLTGAGLERATAFVENGGVLVRFASTQATAPTDDLVPVRLRRTGRTLGSTLSWDQPQKLSPFTTGSPFYGLRLPEDVTVKRQLLAEPDANLSSKSWAQLEDGTPLVTGAKRGKGLVTLIHVPPDLAWSNLALSGLFVDMLRKLIVLSPAGTEQQEGDERGPRIAPTRTLDGSGAFTAPPITAKPIALGRKGAATLENPPGFYGPAEATVAVNTLAPADALYPLDLKTLPVRPLTEDKPLDLRPALLSSALMLFLLDALATLFLAGGLARLTRGLAGSAAATAAMVLTLMLVAPERAQAQADTPVTRTPAPPQEQAIRPEDLRSALVTRLAFVITGDREVDETSRMGLVALSRALGARTAFEPGDPIGIDLARDEIVFYPLIYWPMTPGRPAPPANAIQKVDAFMRNGGIMLFDTRDAFSQRSGREPTPETRRLREVLERIDVPELELVRREHVINKAFYLLESFVGRYSSGQTFIEALPPEGQSVKDRPAQGGDRVSPIIITSNDLAAAWAVDRSGQPRHALVGSDPRQREMSLRAGVNIVMYAMTGNYKSDQVHVPALLERLGQ